MIRYLLFSLGPALVTVVSLGFISAEAAGALGILTAVVMFIGAELLATAWRIERSVLLRDIAHALLSAGTAQVCVLVATAGIGETHTAAAAQPLAVQVAAIVVGSDFLSYWAHRAQHRSKLLWQAHAVHHMPIRLYWLNGLRAHPADTAWAFVISTIWVLICGFSAEAFVVAGAITTSHLLLQHTRIRFPRQLEAMLVTPAWHRVHHDIDASGANLGQILTLWDRLFGTFRPSAPAPVALGIAEDVEDSWWGEVAFGFGVYGTTHAESRHW